MKLNIKQIIYFCLINYVFTFPNDLFDELWQKASDNPIGSQPKIKALRYFIRKPKLTSRLKIEPDEEQFHERWQGKTAPKGIVKIEHEQHYGAVKVERTVKIKHEPHYEDVKVKLEQNDESKKDFIKVKVEEVRPSVEEHGQRLTTASAKTKDGAQTSMAPKRQPPIVLVAPTSVSKRSRQIRAKSKMLQNESSKEDNCSEESEEANNRSSNETFEESDYSESEDLIEPNHKNYQQNLRKRICHSDKEKLKIVNKFLQMKQKCKGQRSCKESDKEIADKFGVNIHTINQWKKQFGKRELGQTRPKYSDDEKLKIVKKLMQMKKHCGEGVKACKETDKEIAERFGVNVRTITRWKKAFGLSRKLHEKEERKHLVEKFEKMKAELTRDEFKNSYPKQIDETVAKELGLNLVTIYAWKRELGQTKPNKHSHSEQKELMKRYYEIKGQTPKLKDVDIVKILKIGKVTLYKWKKQFKRQQFLPNSVDGHSVEENVTSNVRKIGNLNSESI